ncbi:Do family serine endopeptidase [Thalassospiraceae bacterium LMO-JJ14]|nr:Do family serine endopeptidase [Thalassospiraceae bacterium LMO-JJ14]
MLAYKNKQKGPALHPRRRYKKRIVAVVALGAAVMVASAFSVPLQAKTPPSPVQLGKTDSVLPASFADIVERVSPAVVNIQVTSHASPVMTQMQDAPANMREFFERYFNMPDQPGAKRFGAPDGRGQGEKRIGAGSGFVIDAEGHIVTNEHVVHNADEITVTFKDGTSAKARLIGLDDKTDLALLKIDSDKPVPYVNFGKSNDVRVGDWVLTVGNPFGLGHSVNVGIVSARGRTIGAGPYDDFLQIDAPINRGNSGGPAFDVSGNVVGVNSAIFSPNGGNVGIGFAIPSEIAAKVVAELKTNGTVERGWLGVSIQSLSDDIAEGLGLKSTEGVLVADVNADSPASKAGMKVGDVILAVDGRTIKELKELPRLIADIDPGKVSDVTVWRDGSSKSLDVKIGTQPASKKIASATPSETSTDQVGLALQELNPDIARELGMPENTKGVVVVEVKPGSPAEEKGLRRGDVVTKAGGRDIASPGELAERLDQARKDGRKSVLALVKRGTEQRFVALPVGAA